MVRSMQTDFFLKALFITLIYVSNLTGLHSQTKVISTGDEWLFYDDETPLPEDWFKSKKTDKKWKKGISPLGYGDSIVATTISFGNDPRKKHITKYFTKTFSVEDPYEYLIYKLNVQRDDGLVVYLNGHEIMRSNMPNGIITDSTYASSLIFKTSNENIIHTKLISPDDFVSGTNTISASVHQARRTSSDCLFNLELIGSDDSEMIPILLKEQTIKNLNLNLKLMELNHGQEIENKNLQLKMIEQSKSSMRNTLVIAGVLLLLVVLYTMYLWRSFASREKLHMEKITELKEATQSKDREMMNISLSLLNERQFLKVLRKELEENIKKTTGDNEILKGLKQIVKDIDYNLDFNEDWENLKKHFNAVHAGYVDKLSELHPSLTEIELRHCIFIKLHMQTKEIANVLHIDPRSVQASRYRLKKKMNLDENTDLKEYLIKI